MFLSAPPFFGASPVSVAFKQGVVDLNSGSRSVAFTSLGTRTGKWVVQMMSSAGGFVPTAATLNGTGLTKLAQGTGSNRAASIWITDTDVTTDGTDTVGITVSASQDSIAITVYAVDGLQSTTARDSQAQVANASPGIMDLDTVANGVVFACSDATGTISWTGITADYANSGSGTFIYSSGYALTPTAETPRTVRATHSSTAARAGVAVSLR